MAEDKDVDPATRQRITAEAVRRGGCFRKRRRIVGGAVALVSAVMGVSAAAVALNRHTVRVAVAVAGTTTTTPPTSTLAQATPSTSTARPASPVATATVAPRATVTSTTARPAAASTTTAGLALCTASQFVTTMTTNKTSYGLGEAITINLTVRNTSSQGCGNAHPVLASDCSAASASNSTGISVWESNAAPDQLVLCPLDLRPVIVPGNAHYSVSLTWHQHDCTQPPASPPSPQACPRTQVPAGTYTINGDYGPIPPPPVRVQILSS